MKNKSLAIDYITRAGHRLAAVELLLSRNSYADVVREAQEMVELSLKAMRRDRELSFYGTEDLTPSEFYKADDAQEAFENAKWVYSVCRAAIIS